MEKKNVYEIVTQKILEKMEKGIIPWKKSWSLSQAVNWETQKPYRGINALLLDAGEYATFNKIKESGGQVKKGEKGSMVAFFQWNTIEDENTGKEKKIPFLKYYTVFEINTQCENMTSNRKAKPEIVPIDEAEKIIAGYATMPKLAVGNPAYAPRLDVIAMPDKKDFNTIAEYYATMFHEMVHSTGSVERLNRIGVANYDGFGSDNYSKEELVAEMGSAMLQSLCNIETPFDNSVAYLQNWSKRFQNDPKLIVTAAQQAQKAVDYILGTQYAE